jgi:hypothetical protein
MKVTSIGAMQGFRFFDLDKNTVSKDVFKEANGFSLGDVAQSATLIDSLLYVVVNNSAKVVVVSASTFKQQSVISITGSSPRYLLAVNDSIAYVTELYANKIWIVNTKTGNIGNIPVAGETNQMEKVNDQVFVAERTKFNGASVAQIRVINALSHQTAKVISLPTQPNSICKDMAGNIWALTDTGGGKPASLIAIDNSTLSVTKQFDFPTGKTPNRLRYNTATHSLCYLLGTGVYSSATTLTALPTTPLFTTSASIPYAFDIDEKGKYYVPMPLIIPNLQSALFTMPMVHKVIRLMQASTLTNLYFYHEIWLRYIAVFIAFGLFSTRESIS